MMVQEWVCLKCVPKVRGSTPVKPQPDPDWPCRICKNWNAYYRLVDAFLLELELAVRDSAKGERT